MDHKTVNYEYISSIDATKADFTLTEDGDFGLQTDTALRAFQQQHGLVADGIAGSATRSALGLN